MSQGQPKPPTFESLVEELKPDTRRRLMRIFDRFGETDKQAVNKIIEWAFEKGKAEATVNLNQILDEHESKVASMLAGFPKFGR